VANDVTLIDCPICERSIARYSRSGRFYPHHCGHGRPCPGGGSREGCFRCLAVSAFRALVAGSTPPVAQPIDRRTDRERLAAAFKRLATAGYATSLDQHSYLDAPRAVKLTAGRFDPAGWARDPVLALSWNGDLDRIASALRVEGLVVRPPPSQDFCFNVLSRRATN
jgi:hypothetical protein